MGELEVFFGCKWCRRSCRKIAKEIASRKKKMSREKSSLENLKARYSIRDGGWEVLVIDVQRLKVASINIRSMPTFIFDCKKV